MRTAAKALTLLFLTLAATNNAVAAGCPIVISAEAGATLLSAPDGVKYKVEPQWIKQQFTGTLAESNWNWAPLDGPAQINGFVGKRAVSYFYAFRQGSAVKWYLLAKSKPYQSASTEWFVASNLSGSVQCEAADQGEVEKLRIDDGSVKIKEVSLKTYSPDLLLTKLGL